MKDQIAHYENKLQYETDSYDLWESITLGKDVVVVDARSEEAYAERHIPGAVTYRTMDSRCKNTLYVNIPHRTMDPGNHRRPAGHLDKNALYVTYWGFH